LSDARFEELVSQYGRQVLNVALRILGNAEQANDVHQEVFLAVWQRWHKYDGQVNWNGYLYTVTVRKSLECARRNRSQLLLSRRMQEEQTTNKWPDAALRANELQQKLAVCLAKLPERQAEVFVLSRIEGLKHEDIAELLGCSQQTVRVHLHRAMKQLARQFSVYLD
jgi:RNA polymerase sigma-70 factor (ECF subfamily)